MPEPTKFWRVLNAVMYVAVPLVVFVVLEMLVAQREPEPWVSYDYNEAAAIAEGKHVDIMAVGSSRVIAGFDEHTFRHRLRELTGQDFVVQNMGSPGRRLIYHYLGLRNLFRDHPEQYRGTTFLIEAPFGLPEYQLRSDEWIYPNFPQHSIANIEPADLPEIFCTHAPFERKLDVTLRVMFKPSELLSNRLRTRNDVLQAGTNWTERVLEKLTENDSRASMINYDINPRGGLRTEFAQEQYADRMVRQWMEDEKEELLRPWRDWDQSVLGDIVHLVQENGGKIVFFEMPMHSITSDIYHSDVHLVDRELFQRQAQEWETPIIETPFEYTDEDFPDKVHLSIDLLPVFSNMLAETYAEDILNPTTPSPESTSQSPNESRQP